MGYCPFLFMGNRKARHVPSLLALILNLIAVQAGVVPGRNHHKGFLQKETVDRGGALSVRKTFAEIPKGILTDSGLPLSPWAEKSVIEKTLAGRTKRRFSFNGHEGFRSSLSRSQAHLYSRDNHQTLSPYRSISEFPPGLAIESSMSSEDSEEPYERIRSGRNPTMKAKPAVVRNQRVFHQVAPERSQETRNASSSIAKKRSVPSSIPQPRGVPYKEIDEHSMSFSGEVGEKENKATGGNGMPLFNRRGLSASELNTAFGGGEVDGNNRNSAPAGIPEIAKWNTLWNTSGEKYRNRSNYLTPWWERKSIETESESYGPSKFLWLQILFSRGLRDIWPAMALQKLTATKTPQAAMVILSVLSKKKMAGLHLTDSENLVWSKSSSIMAKFVDTDTCDTFYSPIYKEDAVCCVLLVLKSECGFCTLRRLIPSISKTSHSMWGSNNYVNPLITKEEDKEADEETNESYAHHSHRLFELSSSLTTTNADGYVYTAALIEPETVFIDLFNVQCCPPLDSGLCSQYCCLPSNTGSAFCGSGLECY